MSLMHRVLNGLLIAVLLPGVAFCATAASRNLDLFELGAPSFTTFTTRDGVPDSVIVSIRTDRQGYVWLGSQNGLARYDGRNWTKIDNPALDGYVDDLFVDHTGTLWAASRAFGLARHDRKHWHLQGPETGMTSRHLRRVVELGDETGRKQLWAVTWDKGLFYRAGGRWYADPGNAELPKAAMLSLARTRSLGGHARMWVGTGNQGLWYREDGGHWQPYHPSGFDPSQIEQLYVSHHRGREALWISAFGSGLWRLDDDGLRVWSRESGDLPTDELYNITETPVPDGGNALWVASRAGLVRIYHDQARVFDRRHGLPSNAVRNLSSWRSPNGTEVLWLATESGVARMIAGTSQWKTVSLLGAHQAGVFGVLVDRGHDGSERLWVTSDGDGLGLYSHGRWRYFSKANGRLPESELRMIKRAPDLDGTPALWLGLRFGKLMRFLPGPRFEPIDTPWPHDPGQAPMDMLSRRVDGRMEQWFATRTSGIYRRTRSGWTAFSADGVQGQWAVVKLQQQVTADGHAWLWATSNQGLARFDGRTWTLLGRDAGLPGDNLIGMSLMHDSTGHPVLWLGSVHHGIIRVDVRDPMHPRVLPDDLPAPPDETAYDATRDSAGRIYICTNAGVQLLEPDTHGYRSRVFTRRNGLVHDECNTNARFIDRHDRFWDGTLGGLSVFDPRRETPDRIPKPLKLTGVSVDGRPVAIGAIHIPPGHHELRVDYALLSWQHEDATRFRTRLVGYDEAPGNWVRRNYRDFTALPAGDYRLRIEGRDYAGNVSGPLLLPVSVQPHWWQLVWVKTLMVLALLGAVWLLLRWRTAALEKRQSWLEHKITVRTAELNDANERLLALSYQDALTGLANRRRLLETLENTAGFGDRETATTLILMDVDLFKSYNDNFGHPAGDEALRQVAAALRETVPATALAARYGGEEFACLMPDCDSACGRAIAERIRARVASHPVRVPGTGLTRQVTLSAGVASRVLRGEDDAHRLLREADRALYQAKRDGRNCVRG